MRPTTVVIGTVSFTTACVLGLKVYRHYQKWSEARSDEALRTAIVDNPQFVDDARRELITSGESTLLPPRERQRKLYYKEVVAKVKIVMGTPERNAANLLVARRLARQAMEEHGMRPTHIASCLPLVIESVFIESEHERAAREWGVRVRTAAAGWWSGWFKPSTTPLC